MVEKKELTVTAGVITAADLQTILEVNQKAAEIYVEVEKQNEEIVQTISELLENQISMKADLTILLNNTKEAIMPKVLDMDKNLFRLVVLLGGINIGFIITIVQLLKK